MQFISYKQKVMLAMKLCRHEYCEKVGVMVASEAQNLAPILSGDLKRSIASDVIPGDIGVVIGSNMPYALAIEKRA